MKAKKTASLLAAFAMSVAATTPAARAAILDDFGSDLLPSYTPMLGTPAGAWNVAGGQLRPILPSNSADAIFCWNSGAVLASIGDSVSIDLGVLSPGDDGIAQGGLTLWSTSQGNADFSSMVAHIRLCVFDTGQYSLWENSSDFQQTPVTGVTSSTFHLSVAIIGKSAAGTQMLISLTGQGFSPVTQNISSTYTGNIYFGPMAFHADGSNVWIDNLASPAIAVVPEPSPGVLVGAGAIALLVAKRLRTTESAITLHGAVTGPVTSVKVRVGNKGTYRLARGTNAWSFRARGLAPGRNVVSVVASGTAPAAPATARVTIRRQSGAPAR